MSVSSSFRLSILVWINKRIRPNHADEGRLKTGGERRHPDRADLVQNVIDAAKPNLENPSSANERV